MELPSLAEIKSVVEEAEALASRIAAAHAQIEAAVSGIRAIAVPAIKAAEPEAKELVDIVTGTRPNDDELVHLS